MSIHELALAKQSARAAAAAAAVYKIPLVSGTAKPRRVVNVLEETSNGRLRSISYVSETGVDGNPEYAVRLAPIGLILYLLLGSKSVSGAPSAYTHIFTEAATQPYFTAWRMFDNKVWEKLVDCKMVQGVFTSEHGQPVKVALTFNGLDPHTLASATYTTEVAVAESTGTPLMHYDGAGSLQVEAVPVRSIEKIVTTINNNSSFQQGDDLRGYAVAEGMLDVGVETTVLLEDAAEWNRFHFGSATPADGLQAVKDVLRLATGVDFLWTMQASAPEQSLRFALAPIEAQTIAGFDPNTNNDPLKKTSTYKLMKPTSGAGFTATLKNSVASY